MSCTTMHLLLELLASGREVFNGISLAKFDDNFQQRYVMRDRKDTHKAHLAKNEQCVTIYFLKRCPLGFANCIHSNCHHAL